ncbi:MAG: hypothetical protein EHM35_00720 [Planctomycetaceae bacterium]|nr:MAG: hypothetical protein EHM35_00720 [Planctomycetaceae bacterium]
MFRWQQKYSDESNDKWTDAGEYPTLAEACRAAQGFKTFGSSLSGRYGSRHLQQRIVGPDGHEYSIHAL